MPGPSLVAIPFPSQITPALIGGFKSDPSQRQSPTIRETPKRLAVTRAEAEQAAQVQGSSSQDSLKRSRPSNDGSVEDMDTTPNVLPQLSTGGNLLLSNGALPTSVKPDPETANPNYFQEGSGNWNAPASTSSVTSTCAFPIGDRRRAVDEGVSTKRFYKSYTPLGC